MRARVLYIGLVDVPGRRVVLAGYVRGACKGDAKNAKVLDTPTAGGRASGRGRVRGTEGWSGGGIPGDPVREWGPKRNES